MPILTQITKLTISTAAKAKPFSITSPAKPVNNGAIEMIANTLEPVQYLIEMYYNSF